MEYCQEIISGKRCHIFTRGEQGPVIYWGIAAGSGPMAEKTVRMLADADGGDFLLAVYEAEDWNRDFSPWPQAGVREGEHFEGGAPDMLAWLLEACIPYVEGRFSQKPAVRMAAGYSLAGLFALWAYLESGQFAGAASISGSLWYPGWTELLREKVKTANLSCRDGEDCIYLSLGRKEEKTRNPRMAAVGDATRATERIFREQASLKQLILEWNPGGHFTEPERRMARGLDWLLKTQVKKEEVQNDH